MNIKHYITKCKELTLKELIIKVNKKAFEKINNKIKKYKCINNDNRFIDKSIKIVYKYMDLDNLKFDENTTSELSYLIDKYLKHEFDLLGSGWTSVNYDSKPVGVEGNLYTSSLNIKSFDREGNWIKNILPQPYVEFSKGIWSHIFKDYTPIDWQRDFKSGYRYNSKGWYKEQPIGKYLGVDIKVPWELARMQHLPQMAIGAAVLEDYRENILLEFKNVVLDFVSTNPPNIGCNWTCTMDVAIRISNILIAYDILSELDEKNILDEKFKVILANAAYEHGKFIISNLEWNGDKSGNHYFSDISGLLFIGAYLNRTETTDAWLAFAIQEVIHCVKTQFYEDGTNFEASTSYHRLSGELALYDTALIYGILNTDRVEGLKNYNTSLVKRLKSLEEQEYDLNNKKFFSDWYLNKLFKCGCFTYDLMKANNHIPQVGDNDSGRFFKFSYVGKFISYKRAYEKYDNLKNNKDMMSILGKKYFDEDILDHSAFISAMSGLFQCKDFEKYSIKYPVEKSIIEALCRGTKYKSDKNYKNILLGNGDLSQLDYSINSQIIFKEYGINDIDKSVVKLLPYNDFGIYVFKSDTFFMSVFAGGNGQNGNGGHAHNDKLSFELNIDGKDLFIDAGTYLYTPLPEKRDKFRGVKSHNVPIVEEKEQNDFITAFSMKNDTKCSVVNYSDNSIKIYLQYKDVKVVREFIIYNDRLVIKDSCNKNFRVNFNRGEVFSNGYGKLTNFI